MNDPDLSPPPYRIIWVDLELEGWCLDDEKWPVLRTISICKEWFTVEFHSMVIDLYGDPLVDDGI